MPSEGNVSISPTLPSVIYLSLIPPPSALYPLIIPRPQTLAVQPFSLSVSLNLGFALWFYHTTETTGLQSSQLNPSSSLIPIHLFLSSILKF